MKIWRAQLIALCSLYGKYSSRFLGSPDGDARGERLAWASRNVGREIASFNDLRPGEAAQLIDMLKEALG